MNKKFLKSLAALFAVAILGVSCSSNPNDPNNEPVKITLSDVQKAVRKIGALSLGSSGANGSADFSSATVNKNGTVLVEAIKGGTDLSASKLKAAITGAMANVTLANTTVESTISSFNVTASGNDNRSFTITFTAKSGYVFDGFDSSVIKGSKLTITVTLKPVQSAGGAAENWAS